MPGFGPGIEQGAIGEGFGDFLAGMYYLNHGNATYQSTRRYCIADWDATAYNPFNGPSDGSGCLRWIDGTDELERQRHRRLLGDAERGPQRRSLLVGGDDLHLRGPRRQRRGAQQRAQAGHRPQRDARPRLVRQRLRGLGRGARECRPDVVRRHPRQPHQRMCARSRPDRRRGHRHHSARRTGRRQPGRAGRRERLLPWRRQRELAGDRAGGRAHRLRLRPDHDLLRHPGDDAHLHRHQRRRDDVEVRDDQARRHRPDTEITSGPKKKTSKKKAKFKFGSDDPGATFECSLDGASFKACSSPAKVKVDFGKHKFQVRATDQAGNQDGSVAKYSWKRKPKHKHH